MRLLYYWAQWTWHRRWHILFFILVATVALFPYMERNDLFVANDWLKLGMHSLIALAILRCIGLQRNHWWLIALVVVLVTFRWMPRGFTSDVIIALTSVVLYCYLLHTIVHYIKSQGHIGTEELYAVGCLFLMLGLLWTVFYESVLIFYPVSFALNGTPFIPTWGDLFYLSFVTLPTLGYGDIVALSPQARALALLEVLTGLFFIAIILSGAVNMHLSWRTMRMVETQRHKEEQEAKEDRSQNLNTEKQR